MGEPARDRSGGTGERHSATAAPEVLPLLALQLFAQGASPRQIALRHRVREEAVYAALARVMDRLGALTAREAVAAARARGLIALAQSKTCEAVSCPAFGTRIRGNPLAPCGCSHLGWPGCVG